MIPGFDIQNWYWFVGGDQTRAYSSAVGDFVASNDPTFQAWLAAGNKPVKIDTEFNLGQVISQQSALQFVLRPVAVNVLDGYKDIQATNIIAYAAFRILFNHENRLRACERALSLNGSPPDLTPAQAKAAVKAIL